MRISDWSSDVCSSDLLEPGRDAPAGPALGPAASAGVPDCHARGAALHLAGKGRPARTADLCRRAGGAAAGALALAATTPPGRSEEHTSELQSLMRISYAVFCLTKKTNTTIIHNNTK